MEILLLLLQHMVSKVTLDFISWSLEDSTWGVWQRPLQGALYLTPLILWTETQQHGYV